MPEVYLSRAGFEKLRKDLDELKKERTRLSEEIGEAASQGDLRENFGYHAAKARQADVLRRIAEIEQKLLSARLFDELDIPKGEVRIGTRVTLEEVPSKETYEWALVGADEADADDGKISVHAPLSQGLLGHKAGETVKVELPRGPSTYKILKVERL
ncbi:MAG: transcription elongation factor GreA [Elusimicrobia bacterium]|nr:transcription elongation factor GreA [Elusimicrobiota bacterium]